MISYLLSAVNGSGWLKSWKKLPRMSVGSRLTCQSEEEEEKVNNLDKEKIKFVKYWRASLYAVVLSANSHLYDRNIGISEKRILQCTIAISLVICKLFFSSISTTYNEGNLYSNFVRVFLHFSYQRHFL